MDIFLLGHLVSPSPGKNNCLLWQQVPSKLLSSHLLSEGNGSSFVEEKQQIKSLKRIECCLHLRTVLP